MSRLPRAVRLFGAVSLVNDFASEMIYPLLPAFVTTVLGAGPAALGALDGAADFTAALAKLGAGRLADRSERRGVLIVVGYLVAVVVRPVIAATALAWQVIALRVIDRVGKGVRTPPRDALIADVTPADLRGRAFGLQRGMDHAGAVLGPLAAWRLLAHAGGAPDLRRVIAASAVPGVLVLALALWAVKQAAGETASDGEPADGEAAGVSRPTARRSTVRHSIDRRLIPLSYLLRMPETLFILRSQQLGVPLAAVLLLWAALHVVRSTSSFAGGAMADRLGAPRTMWLGWMCYALVAAGFVAATAAWQAWALFLGFGVVAGFTESPERALVARVAGPRQGTAFGRYHGVTGLAALAGGIGLGTLYQGAGGAIAFAASAVGTAALTLAAIPQAFGGRTPVEGEMNA